MSGGAGEWGLGVRGGAPWRLSVVPEPSDDEAAALLLALALAPRPRAAAVAAIPPEPARAWRLAGRREAMRGIGHDGAGWDRREGNGR